ncbi:MAG: hypothetical protein P8P55_00315 [Flavobacteriaceae bacterium]|jgi:hypothetical protein|nr:hypothetical protein [Flavobacteriaceae bacterium]
MKIISKISVLLLTMIAIISCDKLEELADIDFTESFTETVSVDVNEESETPQSWSESSTINIASNSMVQEYKDLIKDININSLEFEINDFLGVEGATISDASMSFGETSITLEDINLQEADTNNTVFPVSGAAQLNAIADELQKANVITTTFSGTISGTPVKFDVIITLDITVTANALQ